jgi:Flp pilus assembly protein TadB
MQKTGRGGLRPPLAMLVAAGAMAILALLAIGQPFWAVVAAVVTAACVVGLVVDSPRRRKPIDEA